MLSGYERNIVDKIWLGECKVVNVNENLHYRRTTSSIGTGEIGQWGSSWLGTKSGGLVPSISKVCCLAASRETPSSLIILAPRLFAASDRGEG